MVQTYNEAWKFLHMPTQPSLLDLFNDKNGGLGVFRRQIETTYLNIFPVIRYFASQNNRLTVSLPSPNGLPTWIFWVPTCQLIGAGSSHVFAIKR